MILSPHFDSSEFKCKCAKQCVANPDKELIEKLEKLFNQLDAKSIYITSGYRCPAHSSSPAVGGSSTDAHTKNIAADIVVYKKTGGQFTSDDIAEAAEIVGFSGIGIIDSTAVHVDVRNSSNYVNSHWFGDERTHNDYIKTFIRNKPKTKKTINVSLSFDDHIYSGLLGEE